MHSVERLGLKMCSSEAQHGGSEHSLKAVDRDLQHAHQKSPVGLRTR